MKLATFTLAFVTLLSLTSHQASAQTAADITDLILVTGQSNAQGSLTDYDPTIDTVHPRVLAFTSDGTWQQADLHQAWDVNDWHPGNGSLADPTRAPYNNFAFHFAKSIAAADPTRVVGIVLASAPGEGIQHWDLHGSFYNEVENKALAALNAIPGKASFDGILWHQGETDALFLGTSDPDPQVTDAERGQPTYYPEKLSALINNFRNSTWFESGKPFICGETKKSITTAGQPSVNGRLMELNTDGNPWTGCVVANDLTTRDADPATGNVGTHFDANGLRVLGQRYANEYLDMTGAIRKDGAVKIMAVGDSITQGVAGQVSYRVELNNLLNTTGCSVEWVGGRGTSPLFHEGYSGQSADQFFNATNPTQGRINTLMTTYNPDVVLLHLGSNDMRKSQTVQSTVDEINELINRIKNPNNNPNDNTYSDTTILIANVIPWWGSAFENGIENPNITSDISQLGTAIENLVASRSESDLNISLVDVRTGFTPPMMVSDLIHPNRAGEAFIADAFLHSYGLYYDCAQSPDLTAPRTFITVPAENENLEGTTTFSGYATDTGGSGIARVRVAVRNNTTQDWYSFSDGTFGPISNNGIRDLIPPPDATDGYFQWDTSITLPTGSYQFFALAEDGGPTPEPNNGNNAFDGLGLSTWPVNTPFTVTSQAPPPLAEFVTQLQNLSTDKCIEITNQATNSNANADTNSCINNAAHQQLYFKQIATDSNTYTIQFQHSNLCLTVPDSATNDGASLTQQNCIEGDLSQQFTLIDESGDKSRIALRTNTTTGKVLDSHAVTDDLIQWIDRSTNNQRWAVVNLDTDPTPPVNPTDTIAPTATITTPANNNQPLGLSPTLTGIVTDNDGGSGVDRAAIVIWSVNDASFVTLNGTPGPFAPVDATLPGGNPQSANWSIDTSLPIGTYVLHVYPYDANGNFDSANRVSRPFNVVDNSDTIAPTATITSPANDNQPLGLSPTLTGIVTDNDGGSGVDRAAIVIWSVNDASFVTLNGTPGPFAPVDATLPGGNPQSANWSIDTSLPIGTYVLHVYPYDAAGNFDVANKVSRAFNVVDNSDDTAPTATITTPATANQTIGLSPTLTGTITDNNGGSGVDRAAIVFWSPLDNSFVTLDGTPGPWAPVDATLPGGNPPSATWNLNTSLPIGTYVMYVYPYDAAGNFDVANRISKAFTVVDTSDTIAPTATITTPATASQTIGQSPTLTGTITDNNGGSGVDRAAIVFWSPADNSFVTLNGTPGPWAPVDATLPGGNPQSASWSLDTSLPVGTYVMYVYPYDAAGNFDVANRISRAFNIN